MNFDPYSEVLQVNHSAAILSSKWFMVGFKLKLQCKVKFTNKNSLGIYTYSLTTRMLRFVRRVRG